MTLDIASTPTPPLPKLYCGLCSAPCQFPRLNLPLPSRPYSPSLPPKHSHPQTLYNANEWTQAWHGLRLRTGLVNPLLFPDLLSTSASTLPSNSERVVLIHIYCLDSLLAIISQSPLNNAMISRNRDGPGSEVQMMLEWSIPKWTGHAPWSNPTSTSSKAVGTEGVFDSGRDSRFWRGTSSQRMRFDSDGDHLLPDDLISPFTIHDPTSNSSVNVLNSREQVPHPQKSHLPNLPSHILTNIFQHLLSLPDSDHPTPSSSTSETIKHSPPPPSPPLLQNDIESFFSLLHTCAQIHTVSIPSSLWILLIRDNLRKYRLGLLSRWSVNPSGSNLGKENGAESLSLALDDQFVRPIEDAIEKSKGEESLSARDVWDWWMYNQSWRSRRRIWNCVMLATATARDADWW